MEETGIVKEIKGLKAVVTIQKQSSGCESCPGSSVCKTMGAGEVEVEAVNRANAAAGDKVRVSFKSYTYLKGTFLVYGIPSLMLVIGAVIGKEYLSRLFPGFDADIISAICGFGMFGISFVALKFWSKRYDSKKEYMPVVEEIIKL